MMARRSLSTRLVRDLAIVQAAVIVVWMLIFMAFSPYVNYEELAAGSSHARVAAAVAARADGSFAIAASPELAGYAARRPGFGYAVLIGPDILPGSSPEFARLLAPLAATLPRNGVLELHDGRAVRSVSLTSAQVLRREVVIATTGDSFLLEDIGAFLTIYLPQFAFMFGPAILAAALVVPVVVRRSLRPVRAAAAEAAAIELSSLDRRLSGEGAPSELAPFIVAINALLQRVEEGVERQRMFTANAAHELRTPVAILSARVDLMIKGEEKWAMKRDVRRLAVLVDQLLSAARLERREAALQDDVDLVGLVRDVLSDIAPLALRSARRIELVTAADPASVRGSSQALASALANLVDNALRAEPEDGAVEVRVAPGEGRIRVEVVDHGPGVAAEDREMLFEPFWRKTSRDSGAGLGLSIAHTIARLHGGSIEVADTPGGGATFALDLPASVQQRV